MRSTTCVMAGLAALAGAALAGAAAQRAPTMAQVLQGTQRADWRALDDGNTLYMELDSGRVIIELAPSFAPQLIANLKALVHVRFFDGLGITRAQDNYVVQWGDAQSKHAQGDAKPTVAAQFERSAKGAIFTALPDADVYAAQTGFVDGFPAARDAADGQLWLTHCYGMVGVGRDDAPDSGNGSELYAVIGHAPRHLDRNIALIGRVVQGMELLSVMPRGTAAMGFYEKPQELIPIRSIRLAADLPKAQRTSLELLRTDSAAFAALIESRRNRSEAWFTRPAGRIDVCNVPLPVRPAAVP